MSTEIDVMCRQCDAKCCRYFCFEIDQPETFEEFENLRWFLLHEGISIHIDEGNWFISIENKCRNLDANGRCAEYASRPVICRKYAVDGCDAVAGDYEYDAMFSSAEQIAAYARKKLGARTYDRKWAELCGQAPAGKTRKPPKPKAKGVYVADKRPRRKAKKD